MDNLKGRAWPWLLLIVIVAVLIRLPYWEVIPASFDEVEQTSFAYQIANGQILPLTGNDAYAGPFYFYVVAGLIKLGATNPMIGRLVILVAGILTVPVTYSWVQTLGRDRLAALIAAAFVALNPDLILVNSHIGGTTLLLPFLSTLFLLAITAAAERDSIGWLIAAGVVAGLAIQSNMVAVLPVAGGLLWFLFKARQATRLGKRWPLWPMVLGLIVLIIFSPVIIYNVSGSFGSVSALEGKSYLWEDNPSVATTLTNIRRFSFQTIRQTGGVLDGDEDFGTLLGFPLVYLILMLAGLVYTTIRISKLPLFVIAPMALVMPVVSSHYGFSGIGRFTTLLVPVWAAVISFLLAMAAGRARTEPAGRQRSLYTALLTALGLVLMLYPIASLATYYRQVNEAKETGRAILELSRYPVSNNRGEPVYISTIEELSGVRGIPYVPHAAFLLGDIYHEFLTPEEIIGRLYVNAGPAYLLLSDRDASVVGQTAPLERLDIAANEEAALRNYGLYRFSAEEPLRKPDFVLGADDLPEALGPNVTFGGGVQLLGCRNPILSAAGDSMAVDCYWQREGDMPPGTYIGFAHLLDSSGGLLGQDDHILGRERYPLNAWQPDEIIRESYTVPVPEGAAAGDLRIALGIYTWPSLERLIAPGNPDNVAVLASDRIEQAEE
jgi:4-amino-4-deoxy-L-arabinose transferase-like glycosyltransferase